MRYWHYDLNYPAAPGCVGADSRLKFVWWRGCHRHAAELTVQAANGGSFVHCIYCSGASLPPGIQPASKLAAAAEELLRAHPSVQLIMTEARVLNGQLGGYDGSVLLRALPGSTAQRRLEVDTDGPQHSLKRMYNTTPQQQRAADMRKDWAAWKQRRSVLRLHHADQQQWAEKIDKAVQLASSSRYSALLLYTSSYHKRDRKLRTKVGEQAGRGGAAHSHSIARGRRSPWYRTGCPS